MKNGIFRALWRAEWSIKRGTNHVGVLVFFFAPRVYCVKVTGMKFGSETKRKEKSVTKAKIQMEGRKTKESEQRRREITLERKRVRIFNSYKQTNSVALSPRANYTD
jgi:hypothetical protein